MYYHMLSLAILRKFRRSLRHGEAAVESRRSLEVKVSGELFRLSCLANKKTHHHSLLLLVRARVSWELSEEFLLFGFVATTLFWLAILLQYHHIVFTQVRTVSIGAVTSFTGCTRSRAQVRRYRRAQLERLKIVVHTHVPIAQL
jgi:hypothetical protein